MRKQRAKCTGPDNLRLQQCATRRRRTGAVVTWTDPLPFVFFAQRERERERERDGRNLYKRARLGGGSRTEQWQMSN